MHIMYVSQYFPPEMGAPAARVHELSREWVKVGHQVSVLTAFANHPTGQKLSSDKWRFTRREHVDGIEVVRSYIWATPNEGVVKRMISYASFMASAPLIGAVRVQRPDIVIATSPQLLCAVAGYLLALRFQVPFVFEVRDLWPEGILAAEGMTDNLFIRALKLLAMFLYSHADRIVTVGEGYRDEIHECYGIKLDDMDVVPNGIDIELFIPGLRNNEVRRAYGWDDRFVVLYLGTHGMAHALHTVVDAAARIRTNHEILFVFVGEGAEKANLKRQAAELELSNVQFIDQQPKHRVPLFYSACDLGLVSLRNKKLYQTSLPSKIFEYLGMAKPILVSIDGHARKLVEKAQAGWHVPPEEPEKLSDAVLRAFACRDRLCRIGELGRQYVLDHYDRRVLAATYLSILERVIDNPRRAGGPKHNFKESESSSG